MRCIYLAPRAINDLNALYDPLYSAVIERLELLRIYPMLGPVLEGKFSNYRKLTIGVVRVVYRILEGAIFVAYVRHVRREFPPKHYHVD